MKNFDVQSAAIPAAYDTVFAYLADPKNLPAWTKAFSAADETSAVLSTPAGELKVGLKVTASHELGVIDWHMTMPDGAQAAAYSRLTPNGAESVYTFVLMAPPGPIEQVEGTLHEQMKLLAEELENLKRIFGATA